MRPLEADLRALYEAVDRDDIPAIAELLDKVERAGHVVATDDQLILRAVDRASVDTLRFVLANGASCNVANEHGITPLFLACDLRGGRPEIVSALIDAGANVNAPGPKGFTPLHRAAAHGLVGVVEELVRHGADITCVSTDDRLIPLHWAIVGEHEDAAVRLIELGSSTNARDAHGFTPLMRAAQLGLSRVAAALMAGNVERDARTTHGATALHLAAMAGHERMVHLLLNNGANMDAVENAGATPLILAADHGHLGVVQTLLAAGANVNARAMHGITALISSATAGYTDVTRILVAAGADQSLALPNGDTALHCVARGDCNPEHADVPPDQRHVDLDLLNALSGPGAPVNVPNEQGSTPLLIAIEGEHDEAMKLLLSRGADIECADERERTLLFFAAMRGNAGAVRALLELGAKPIPGVLGAAGAAAHVEVVSTLVDAGVDVNDRSGPVGVPVLFGALGSQGELEEMTARLTKRELLQLARDREVVVDLLLKAGADPNATDAHRRNLLHLASEGTAIAPVARLAAAGAKLDHRDASGRTPLISAVLRGNAEVARKLVEAGADVNAANEHGFTVLMVAVKKRQRAIAELLITHGAKVDTEVRLDGRVFAACDLAATERDDEMLELLLAHGARGPNGPGVVHCVIDAIRRDDPKAVARFVEAGADIRDIRKPKEEGGGTVPEAVADRGGTAARPRESGIGRAANAEPHGKSALTSPAKKVMPTGAFGATSIERVQWAGVGGLIGGITAVVVNGGINGGAGTLLVITGIGAILGNYAAKGYYRRD